MTPDSILKDDIKSENQIVAKEFEQQMKPNNKLIEARCPDLSMR